jgi:hypothetical protein
METQHSIPSLSLNETLEESLKKYLVFHITNLLSNSASVQPKIKAVNVKVHEEVQP